MNDYKYKYTLDKDDVNYLFWETPFFRNTSYNRTATRKTMFIVLLIPIFIFGFGLIFSLIRRDLFENYQVISYLFLSGLLLIVEISVLLYYRIYLNFYKDKHNVIIELSINDDGIKVQQPDGSNRIQIKKDEISKILIKDHFITIIYNNIATLGIPIKIFNEYLTPIINLKASLKNKPLVNNTYIKKNKYVKNNKVNTLILTVLILIIIGLNDKFDLNRYSVSYLLGLFLGIDPGAIN